MRAHHTEASCRPAGDAGGRRRRTSRRGRADRDRQVGRRRGRRGGHAALRRPSCRRSRPGCARRRPRLGRSGVEAGFRHPAGRTGRPRDPGRLPARCGRWRGAARRCRRHRPPTRRAPRRCLAAWRCRAPTGRGVPYSPGTRGVGWARAGGARGRCSGRSGPRVGAGTRHGRVDVGDEAGFDQGAPQAFGVTEPRSTSPTAAGSGPGLDAGSGPAPGRGRVGMRHGLRRRPGHHGSRKRSRAGHRPTPGTGDGETSPGRPSGAGRAGRDTATAAGTAVRRRPSGTGHRRQPTGTADRRRPTCGLLHPPAPSPLRPPASTARSPRRPSRRRRACAGAGRGAGHRTARSRRRSRRWAPVASRRGPAGSAPWSRRRRGSSAPLPRRRRRATASSPPVVAPRRRRGRQGRPGHVVAGETGHADEAGEAHDPRCERAGAVGRTTPPHGETGPRPERQPFTEGRRRIRVWRHGSHGG